MDYRNVMEINILPPKEVLYTFVSLSDCYYLLCLGLASYLKYHNNNLSYRHVKVPGFRLIIFEFMNFIRDCIVNDTVSCKKRKEYSNTCLKLNLTYP
jgi:hypothetical protein